MGKSKIIRPVGLKGNEKLNRIKELMGKAPIKENVNRSVVELTKEGPDGNIYAIVRENHEYYIKITDKKSNLVTEDFEYIGGLQNKTDKSYGSYAKAIKQLNLKFMSLNDAGGKSGNINTFKNDNMISEHHGMKANSKFSTEKGVGKADEYIVNKKGEKLSDTDIEEEGGDNLANKKTNKDFEKVKLSETEEAIDAMITGEEEVVEETKKGYSIARAIQEMDDIIGDAGEEEEEVDDILESLSPKQKAIMLEALKKKS
jgi:hypothetical protein